MGQLRFLIPHREQAGPEFLARGYLAGIDDMPWRTRLSWTEEGVLAERADRDSCYFYVPWRISGHGALTLSTATLLERTEPYHLPVELARGTLNRFRNQLAGWEGVGLVASPAVRRHLQTATKSFVQAVQSAPGDASAAANLAQAAIQVGLDGLAALIDDFIEQSISARRRTNGKLPTLLGATLDANPLSATHAQQLQSACNTACVPFVWRDIEPEQGQFDWSGIDRQIDECHALGLRVCAGPVVRMTDSAVPDWLSLWEGDFENLISFLDIFVEAAVSRYRGKVALWHAAASINVANAIHLPEEQQLRIAAHVLEAVRRAEPQAPVIVSVDQPWAEYMGRRDLDLSPLHFADAIARADLGIAGIGLELNFGFGPQATLPRDWLELSRQLDRWTALGLPLIVFPTLPDVETNGLTPSGTGSAGALQRAWADRFLSLILSKPVVQGIFWGQWQDDEKALLRGGLIDVSGREKPALAACQSIRERWLN